MDWITTSGRTLDEAKSHALDQLGIVADEAEFDVVNDVEKGLFGRVKTEAKIRARVRPKQTATKDDRGRRRNGGGNNRNRNQKGGGRNNKGRKGEGNQGGKSKGSSDSSNGSKKSGGAKSGRQGGSQRSASASGNDNRNDGDTRSTSSDTKPKQSQNKPKADKPKNDKPKKDSMEEHMDRQDQERAAQDFLEGVLGAFGMTGAVAVVDEPADDDAIEMVVTGEELGLLVGQKGVTLNSLQELTRTVVQRRADGAKTDRLRVDVAGYRARRTAALQAFAVKIASEVVDTGTEKLLEPMGPADRKVVQDALTDVDGVETGSEGEEPRRRVVIRPS